MADIIVIEKQMLKSPAFRSLNGTSIVVLCDFLMRRKIHKTKNRKGRNDSVIITNNGQITYCYSEALRQDPPISRMKFAKAIDQLVEHGFIDIKKQGNGGVKGDKSLYACSERWKNFGTLDFIQSSRRKDTRKGRGFASYWKKAKGPNIGIENNTGISIKNDTPLRKKDGMGYQ